MCVYAGCLGDQEYLLAYESERQRRVVPVMAGIDGLNHLYSYSNRVTPVVLLRNIGCDLTYSIKPVKVRTKIGPSLGGTGILCWGPSHSSR